MGLRRFSTRGFMPSKALTDFAVVRTPAAWPRTTNSDQAILQPQAKR